MKVEEAIRRMRRTEAFEVFRKEWIEKRMESEQAVAMGSIAEPADVYKCERAKGAFNVLANMLAAVDLDIKESEDDDV